MLVRFLVAVASLSLADIASAATRAATPEELAFLRDAMEKTAREIPRWACTQTMVRRDDKGQVKSEEVVRYDPSKPYLEQWTPLLINGKPPREKDFRKYRTWGERARKRDEHPEQENRYSLGEVMNLAAAQVASVGEHHIVYEIPLRKDRNDRFPPEKFEVLARLARDTGTLENIAIRLRSSFRAKLVVKVKAGVGTLNFGVVDAAHPPTLTDLHGDASASIFFVNVGGEYELKRTDFKYVKPYYERFEVQIGPMKAIDF